MDPVPCCSWRLQKRANARVMYSLRQSCHWNQDFLDASYVLVYVDGRLYQKSQECSDKKNVACLFDLRFEYVLYQTELHKTTIYESE